MRRIYGLGLILGTAVSLGCNGSSPAALRKSQAALQAAALRLDGAAPSAAAQETFYESNPTYVSTATDDGFWHQATPESQNVDAALLSGGQAELAARPGALSFLVIRHGLLVKEAYLHGSAVNQSNNIHSASKGIIAALVGLAIKRGDLKSLDATLGELLPDLSFDSEAKRAITLRDLVTMSAGFQWTEDSTEYQIQNASDWVQAIVDLPLASPAGKSFNYCTGQPHIVSAILAKATGMSTEAYAQAQLFAPLGVAYEHWGRDPQGVSSGGYNLYMTPRALAKFALLNLDGGRLAGRELLPRAWVDASHLPAQTVDRQYRYGYYWWLTTLAGHPTYKLWGFGGQFAYLLPDADAVVVLTASTRGGVDELDGDQFLTDYVLPALR